MRSTKKRNLKNKDATNMLRSMNCHQGIAEIRPTPSTVPSKWERNEKEDMKLAMDYLYEFKEKLFKLHPLCVETVHNLLQERRY